MTTNDFATVDVIALVIVGLSAVWGVSSGFTRQFLGFAAWIGAFAFTVRFYASVVPLIATYVPENVVAVGLSFGVTFVLSLLVLKTFAGRMAGGVKKSALGGVDRFLGFCFGVLRGYILLVAGYMALQAVIGPGSYLLVRNSQIAPYIRGGAHYLEGLIPAFSQLHLASPFATGHEAAISSPQTQRSPVQEQIGL